MTKTIEQNINKTEGLKNPELEDPCFIGRNHRFIFRINSPTLDIPEWFIETVDIDHMNKAITIGIRDMKFKEGIVAPIPIRLQVCKYNFDCDYEILDATGAVEYGFEFKNCTIKSYKIGGGNYSDDSVRIHTAVLSFEEMNCHFKEADKENITIQMI